MVAVPETNTVERARAMCSGLELVLDRVHAVSFTIYSEVADSVTLDPYALTALDRCESTTPTTSSRR
jgi:hypothetical protein